MSLRVVGQHATDFNSKRRPLESHVDRSWRATSQICQALREPPGSTRFPWVGGAVGSGWECETLSPESEEHMVHGRMHATPLLINHMSTGGLAPRFQALCLCRRWQNSHRTSLGLSLSEKYYMTLYECPPFSIKSHSGLSDKSTEGLHFLELHYLDMDT